MAIEFEQNQLIFLRSLGRKGDGRKLISILESLKESQTSISSIDVSKDYGAQVEGRKLFGELIDELINELKQKHHSLKEIEPEDYT